MEKVKLGDVTINLDSKRKPLNNQDRKKISAKKLYPYCGANKIMDYVDEYIFDEEIICIAEDGGKWGKNEICSYIMNERCWVNNHVHVLKCNEKININYLKYWLDFNDLNYLITGAIVRKLTQKALCNIEIELPDIKKQISIAKKLDKVQEIIDLRKKQIEELDELIKSQFVEMFGKEEYPRKTLNEVTNKITDGSHNPPSGIEENEGYMMLSSQNIINNSINYDNVRFLKKEDFEKENLRTNLNRGDVLLTIVGTVGRTAIITDETNITLQRSVAVLKPTEEINSIYLVGVINSDDVIRQLTKGAKGVAQKGIYLNDIKKILIPVPPIELQNKFSEIVKQIDKQKIETQKNLEEMQELQESLMNKYFGG